MRAVKNNGILRASGISAIVAAIALVLPMAAHATVTIPGEPTTSSGEYTQELQTSSSCKAATNSYTDGSPKYVLWTQDPARALDTKVTYDGVEYPLDRVIVTADVDLAAKKATSFEGNTTYFVDSGTYHDPKSSNYTRFSAPNISFVGLDPAKKPVFTKEPWPATDTTARKGTIERYLFMNQNVYLENLVFDGQGKDMYPEGDNKPVRKSRGEAMIWLAGYTADGKHNATDGFVLRNSVVRNVGATTDDPTFTSSLSNKNMGMNLFTVKGQTNVENVSFENMKTAGVYGVVNQNQAANNCFKNISIDMSVAAAKAFPVKVEDTGSYITDPAENNSTWVSDLTVSPADRAGIYIQDFNYKNVTVPTNYRYAGVGIANGGWFGPAVLVTPTIQDANAQGSVLDLKTETWIIREGQALTVDQQLATLVKTRKAAGANEPPPNIMLVAEGDLDSFTVPDFGGEPVQISVVSDVNTTLPATALVPLAANATITLPATNADKVKLYNIDFHENARITLQQAVAGVAAITPADPREAQSIADYPKYADYFAASAARVPNSTNATFGNCRFTSLAAELKWQDTPPTSLVAGKAQTVTAVLSGSATDSYTGAGVTAPVTGTADDKTIRYFSSDPAIATVDPVTGVVTAVAPGTVTIIGKSMDANNEGEIERPWVEFNLEVKAPTWTITGRVYDDANRNGKDDTEAPISGVEVELVGPGPDGKFGTADDEVLGTTTTDADGKYAFADKVTGNYLLRIKPDTATWEATTPTTFVVELTGDITVDFGLARPVPPTTTTPTTTPTTKPATTPAKKPPLSKTGVSAPLGMMLGVALLAGISGAVIRRRA